MYSISLYFFHGDDLAASDATQQVFLKLLTGGIRRFRGGAEFSTWLYKMVVNTCLDNAKAGKRRERQAGDGSLQRVAAPGSAEETLARAEVAGTVQTALSSLLTPKLRLPVLLRVFLKIFPVAKWHGGFELFHGDGGIAAASRAQIARGEAGED